MVRKMWVRFTADYNFRKPSFTIAYRAGMTQNVTSECATLAIAAGKAVRMRKTHKDGEPTYAHVDTREYVEDGLRKVERVGDPVWLKEDEACQNEQAQAPSTGG